MKRTFKFLVSIFAVLMIVSIISLAIPMSVTAATTGRDAAVAWANSQINKGLDLDGAYGNQCVDLIYYYYRYLGVAELGGNAVDYAYNTLPIGWRRIPCTSGFVPQPGDIAVWRVNHNWGTGSTGEYGHIGIVVSGDESDYYAINQNHQGKTYCTKNVFPVSALHSVIRPDYSKIGQSVVVSYYEYPNLYSVTETNAVLATHVNLSKISNQGVSRAGIYLYDSDENLIKDCFWNAPFANLLEGTSLDISCNVNSELGKTLTPGTTYKYKFMIVLNGTTYYSPVAEFTTETSILEEKIDYEYTVNDDGKSITLTKYIGEGGDVVIPSEIDGYSVTSIGKAFNNCRSITCVTIPESVTSIEDSAFSFCSNLGSIKIPDSITSICDFAFNSCSSLTSISIPDSVTNIGGCAFANCSGLVNIEIPSSVTIIETFTFDSCSSLKSVTIPESVTNIGNYAFNDCSSLASIEIPNSVTSIGHTAFANCNGLVSVVIPESVTNIGNYVFNNCSSLESVTFETKNVTIGSATFDDCSKLETIYLYRDSTADEYFSDDEYTKVYLDDEVPSVTSDVTVYTEAKKSAIQGSEFTYKVFLEGTYDGYAFELMQPEGLTITNVTAASSEINVDNNDGKWLISVIGGLEKNEAEKEEIVTVTVSVAKDAELGERVLSLGEVFITTESGDIVENVGYNYATITITDQIPGDVNGDGVFNYTDVSKLYAYFRKKATISENIDTDINGDGAFNYTDVSKLYAIFRKKADFN